MRVVLKETRSFERCVLAHSVTLEDFGNDMVFKHHAAEHLEPGKMYTITFEEVSE